MNMQNTNAILRKTNFLKKLKARRTKFMFAVTAFVQPTYVYEPSIHARPMYPKMEVTFLSRRQNEDERGKMSVREAGKRGGEKGGPRVRELIEEGREHENE